MARITRLIKEEKIRSRLHEIVDCTYSVFQIDGKTYIQIDTYGTKEREFVGKASQNIQIDREAAIQLKRILLESFPDIFR